MIDEGKKLTAFDAMEAAMELSNIYRKKDKDKFVSFRFSGICESVDFNFGKFDGTGLKDRVDITVFFEDDDEETFADVFRKIEEEMALYE